MSDGRKRLSGSVYRKLADEKKRKQELQISKLPKINTIFEKSNKLTAEPQAQANKATEFAGKPGEAEDTVQQPDEGQFAEIKGPTEDDTAAPIDPLSFLEHTKENAMPFDC